MFISRFLQQKFPAKYMALSGNDFRHMLRITFAGSVGLFFHSWITTQFGVFYVVYPIMLTGLVPIFNLHIARQMVANAIINCVEMLLLFTFLVNYPLPMTLAVFILYTLRFYLMSRGPLFLFGSMGVICLSVMTDFLSYNTTDMNDLMFSNIIGSFLAVILSAMACFLFPDTEPRQRPQAITKSSSRIMHETLLASFIATLLFVVFQIYTLSDSLAALMAGIFSLFPMHYRGAILSASWRIIGVIVGCLSALAIQIIMYNFSHHLLLLIPLVSIVFILAARIHVFEKVGSGVGFSILTTLGLIFGQYMSPSNDIVFSDLYRLTSVTVSLLATLVITFLMHKLLNYFPATRFTPDQ